MKAEVDKLRFFDRIFCLDNAVELTRGGGCIAGGVSGLPRLPRPRAARDLRVLPGGVPGRHRCLEHPIMVGRAGELEGAGGLHGAPPRRLRDPCPRRQPRARIPLPRGHSPVGLSPHSAPICASAPCLTSGSRVPHTKAPESGHRVRRATRSAAQWGMLREVQCGVGALNGGDNSRRGLSASPRVPYFRRLYGAYAIKHPYYYLADTSHTRKCIISSDGRHSSF